MKIERLVTNFWCYASLSPWPVVTAERREETAMALTKCRECGHTISTEASVCPACGVPEPWRDSAAASGPSTGEADADQVDATTLPRPPTSRNNVALIVGACVAAAVPLALYAATGIAPDTKYVRQPSGVEVSESCSAPVTTWADNIRRRANEQNLHGRVVSVLCDKDGTVFSALVNYQHAINGNRIIAWQPKDGERALFRAMYEGRD